MSEQEMNNCISTAQILLVNLIEMPSDSEEFDLEQTLAHLGAIVAMVSGQIAVYEHKENEVELRTTMAKILGCIKGNFVTVTQFNEECFKEYDPEKTGGIH